MSVKMPDMIEIDMGPNAHVEEEAFRFDSAGRAWSADVAWFQRGAFTGNKPLDVDFLPVFMLRMDRKNATLDVRVLEEWTDPDTALASMLDVIGETDAHEPLHSIADRLAHWMRSGGARRTDPMLEAQRWDGKRTLPSPLGKFPCECRMTRRTNELHAPDCHLSFNMQVPSCVKCWEVGLSPAEWRAGLRR